MNTSRPEIFQKSHLNYVDRLIDSNLCILSHDNEKFVIWCCGLVNTKYAPKPDAAASMAERKKVVAKRIVIKAKLRNTKYEYVHVI